MFPISSQILVHFTLDLSPAVKLPSFSQRQVILILGAVFGWEGKGMNADAQGA